MEQAEGVENKTREHVERMKAKTRMQIGGVRDKKLIKLGKEAKLQQYTHCKTDLTQN